MQQSQVTSKQKASQPSTFHYVSRVFCIYRGRVCSDLRCGILFLGGMPSESEKGGDQYAVVKFPEEGNSVALVHTKWLHGDVCLWPQDSKNVSYLAKCGASPSSNWQVVPCVPIDTFRTYDAARQKLKQAEDGSDLGSEVDLGRGKRKKQRRALSSSPESVQRLPLPPPSMMKKAQKRDGRRVHKQSPHASTSRANDPNICSMSVPFDNIRNACLECCHCKKLNVEKELLQDDVWQWYNIGVFPLLILGDQGAVPCAQMCASETSESEGEVESGGEQDAKQESSGIKRSFTAHSLMKKASQMGNTQCNNEKWHSSQSVAPISDDGIKQVIRLLQTVILRVEHLGSQLDVIKAKLCDQQLQPEADLLEKPFCDITEFELFDQGLSESAAMKSKLVRELAALGGRNVSLSTRRILEALMTQEVAVQYSWLGQKGKKFLSLTTCDLIYKSVKCTFETVKRSEVEDVVKTWLRHAGEKLRKNNKQSEKVTELLE
ncbi:uncharacterized protein [Dermacentor andersoni]|uniref:uncharacterized protein n=1 Tax=Dermacentor andersoni TaxID=34620 RepID=UPI003B3BDA85